MIKTAEYYIQLSPGLLSLNEGIDFIKDDSCGAESIFMGRVRNHNQGASIKYLSFSAYEPMALKEMEQIAQQALQTFDIFRIAIFHRTGDLNIGDIPVIIAVSSSHRKAAFAACEFAIDTLKSTVPIWKKETTTDGTYWVNAHP